MTPIRRDLALKIGGSALVAGALLALFLLGRDGGTPGPPPPPDPKSKMETIEQLDRGIDTVLAGFNIGLPSVRKRSYPIPDEGFFRTERVVTIPDTVVPVSVNAALNTMARRYNARAVASENPRLRTVTIHLELGGTVVHTIILKKAPRATVASDRPRRVPT
jgi:hypothetical protein